MQAKKDNDDFGRELYDAVPFVQKAVSLYAHGISWGGASVYTFPANGGGGTRSVNILEGDILQFITSWIVDGRTNVAVAGSPSTLAAVPDDADAGIAILTPPELPAWRDRGPGRSLIALASSNFPILAKLRDVKAAGFTNEHLDSAFEMIVGEVRECLSIPDWAYKPDEAAKADTYGVLAGLNLFRLAVADYRRQFLATVVDALKQRDPSRFGGAEGFWNCNWPMNSSFAGFEGVYWTFRECGLPLVKFGEDFPKWLRENGYLDEAQGWTTLGL